MIERKKPNSPTPARSGSSQMSNNGKNDVYCALCGSVFSTASIKVDPEGKYPEATAWRSLRGGDLEWLTQLHVVGIDWYVYPKRSRAPSLFFIGHQLGSKYIWGF